mmetsp:Transcript_63280/g.136021  ORF Transcript_63280/g.136021 Transcript_63280/m.136021 type:complete len:317 (+) Transcript_63280:800-1750(+)
MSVHRLLVRQLSLVLKVREVWRPAPIAVECWHALADGEAPWSWCFHLIVEAVVVVLRHRRWCHRCGCPMDRWLFGDRPTADAQTHGLLRCIPPKGGICPDGAFIGHGGYLDALRGAQILRELEARLASPTDQPAAFAERDVQLLPLADGLTDALQQGPEPCEDLVLRKILGELDGCLAVIEVLEGARVTSRLQRRRGQARSLCAHLAVSAEVLGELEEGLVDGVPHPLLLGLPTDLGEASDVQAAPLLHARLQVAGKAHPDLLIIYRHPIALLRDFPALLRDVLNERVERVHGDPTDVRQSAVTRTPRAHSGGRRA